MKRLLCLSAFCAFAPLLAAPPPSSSQPGKPLAIYFVDVEGGQSTLIVTPAGQSLLVDTGWPDFHGRDAHRIAAAARQAGIRQIDYLLITHFHEDHVGGVPQLASRIPIRNFIDHGRDVETSPPANDLHAAYVKTTKEGRRHIAKPGDTIPLEGVQAIILTAAGRHIDEPLPGAGRPNPYCSDVKRRAHDASENAQSVGFLMTYGKFRFIDLGDLTWNKELNLMCPVNRVGRVDVFLVSHHGMNISNSPALVWALHPRVAVMDNGAHKGGAPQAWTVVEHSPGLEDLWQLHYSFAGGKDHNVASQFIASLGEQDQGKEIELSAWPDGSFKVTNARNKFTKSYPAR